MGTANRVEQLNTSFSDFNFKAASAAGFEKKADIFVSERKEVLAKKSTLFDTSISIVPESSGEQELVHLAGPAPVHKKNFEWEAIVQTWEGRVIFNDPDEKEFVAIIRDITCKSNPDEEVLIGYESILASDVELVEEGAVFFWNIGRYRKYSEVTGKPGPSKHKFEIRFRRLPPLSAARLSEIMEMSTRMSERLHANYSA